MSTHTYPHKSLSKICNHQADSSFYVCDWMSALVICKHRKEYGHTWHWMSLLKPGVIKQHETQTQTTRIFLLEDVDMYVYCMRIQWVVCQAYAWHWIRVKHLRLLTLKVLNFWKFTSYCSLKPLWSGMGEVVPAHTSPTLHPHPLPLCINCRD